MNWLWLLLAAPLGAQVSYTPQPIAFGSVKLGAVSAPLSSTLTNTGTDTLKFCGGATLPPACTGRSTMTGSAAFQYVTDNCTARPPGTSCVLQYRFAPTQVGPVVGANVVQTNHGPFPLQFTGTGQDTVTVPPPPTVAYILIQPTGVSTYAGAPFQFTAFVMTAANVRLSLPVTWASQTPALATVDATGLATGLSPGVDTITATAQGVIGQVAFTVLPPRPPPPPPPPPAVGIFLTTLARFGITAAPGTYGPWPIYQDSLGVIVGHLTVTITIP